MSKYRYSISLIYVYNNTQLLIDKKSIKNLVVDYDYDTKNMPIMYISLSLDKNVIDDMILNSTTKTIIVNTSKYEVDSPINIKEDYIREEMIYFLSSDTNPTEKLDYSGKTKDSQDITKNITIGLIKKSLIENNKRLINDVFYNTSLSNIIAKHMTHMNLLMESVNNININRIVIPPMNSITNYIKFVDSYYNLYNNKYRLFYDYNMTYLLSSSGNPVQSIYENIMDVIMVIGSSEELKSKTEGMVIDNSIGAYVINLSTTDISYTEDKVTNVSYNKIIGIDSEGNHNTVSLDNSSSSSQVRIERVTNGNLDNLHNIKSEINNSSIYINIVKSDLDGSVFTMNKAYYIRNYDKLVDKNGKFLLSRKREIYTLDGSNDYILSTILTLSKAIT